MQWAADNWIVLLLIGGMLGMHFFGHRGHGARKVQTDGGDGADAGENVGGMGGSMGGGGCCGGKSRTAPRASSGGGGCCGGKSKTTAQPIEDEATDDIVTDNAIDEDVPMIVKREAPLA